MEALTVQVKGRSGAQERKTETSGSFLESSDYTELTCYLEYETWWKMCQEGVSS